MPARSRLFDHRHGGDHMLVVQSGEISEDGVTYRAGYVRLSSAADRHFLTFATAATCFVVESGVPPITFGSRRVVHLGAEVVNRLAACDREGLCDRTRTLVESAMIRDAAARDVPTWLAEFEQVRIAGRLVTAKGIDSTGAIKARRLHGAWDAVTESELPLAEIAHDEGFADQSHMTRHFVEWIGVTPAGIRRAARQVTRLQDGTLALEM